MLPQLGAASNPPIPLPVRAGGVVLLVGAGSLLCWRLWTHWRGEEQGDHLDRQTPSPGRSPKVVSPVRGRRGLLAALLEEELMQDSEDGDEDDPALIQVGQGRAGHLDELTSVFRLDHIYLCIIGESSTILHLIRFLTYVPLPC